MLDGHEFTPDIDEEMLSPARNIEGVYAKLYQAVPPNLGTAVAHVDLTAQAMRARGLLATDDEPSDSQLLAAFAEAIKGEIAANVLGGASQWTIRVMALKGGRMLFQRQTMVRCTVDPVEMTDQHNVLANPDVGALRALDMEQAFPALRALHGAMLLMIQGLGTMSAMESERYSKLMSLTERAAHIAMEQNRILTAESVSLRTELDAKRREITQLLDRLADAEREAPRPVMDPERVERLAGQAKDTLAQAFGAFMPGGLRDVWATMPEEVRTRITSPRVARLLSDKNKVAELVAALDLMTSE